MFVCIVNCSGKTLDTLIAGQSLHQSSHQHASSKSDSHKKKHCDGKKDCPCCKEHGSFVVKENLKPADSFITQNLPAIAIQVNHVFDFSFKKIIAGVKGPQKNAPPPGISEPEIHILHCSFLI
jgi:hypothetical protein